VTGTVSFGDLEERTLRPFLVKIDKQDSDSADIDIYTKSSKRGFRLKTLRIWLDERGEIRSSLATIEHEGFLCLHCGKAELSDIANGHILIEADQGLCAMCANTEEIFSRHIDYDEKGSYKLKAERHERESQRPTGTTSDTESERSQHGPNNRSRNPKQDMGVTCRAR
jgi:hypothetical protein